MARARSSGRPFEAGGDVGPREMAVAAAARLRYQNPAYGLLPLLLPRGGPAVTAAPGIEFVFVVRREDLFPRCTPHGFVAMAPAELEQSYLRVARERGFFVERREAEVTPAWKQVIPYCLVRFEGRYLLLERLAAQSEARLHGKLSIGVGGHINPEDAASGDPILAAARRELREELVLEGDLELIPLGLLNDDRDAVGAVHVGVVFGVPSPVEPQVREIDRMRGSLTPLADLRGMCQTSRPIESWSLDILTALGWENSF